MRQKLNLITLGVADIIRSSHFYEKGLGWKRSSASMDNLVLFSLGGMVLALHPRKALAEDAHVADEKTGFSGITLSFNAKDEKEVDQVMREAEIAGGTIVKTARKVYWGGYSGYFKDPDGHLIEVAHNPLWKLDENDDVVLP